MSPAPFRQRSVGLLVPAYALRHAADCGIGDTTAVCDAIDFCAGHDFGLLQLLAIHECVGDYSPYNAISSRALSPALLALNEDAVPGLRQHDIDRLLPASTLRDLRRGPIRYADVQSCKLDALFAGYRNVVTILTGDDPLAREFAAFREAQAS